MDAAFLDDIRQIIIANQVLEDDEVLLESGKPKKISENNFHHVRPEVSQRNICYVDGGEAVMADGGTFGFYLIRAFGIIIRKGSQQKSVMHEFHLCVRAGENGIYETQAYALRGSAPEPMAVDSRDARIKDGVDRAKPGKVASLVRRAAEISLAREILRFLEEGDMLVLDGTLETRFEQEKASMEALIADAGEKGVLVIGVSKGSSLMTRKGKHVERLFLSCGPKESWYYHPIAETKGFHLFLCKLHRRSEHVLRLDMPYGALADPGKVFSILAAASKDLSIPGYPYWLVKADRLARVQDSEARYMRQRLIASVKGLEGLIGRDVHDVLDSMN